MKNNDYPCPLCRWEYGPGCSDCPHRALQNRKSWSPAEIVALGLDVAAAEYETAEEAGDHTAPSIGRHLVLELLKDPAMLMGLAYTAPSPISLTPDEREMLARIVSAHWLNNDRKPLIEAALRSGTGVK